MSRFANKTVVITGGTSGIGLAATKQFIEEDAKVVLTGRSLESIADASYIRGAELAADGGRTQS